MLRASALCIALVTASCTTGVDVRPDEMRGLTPVAMHERRDALASTPSGERVVVRGRFDADTIPASASEPRLHFAAPVDARLSDGVLTLSGSNLGPRSVALSSLRAVHVSMVDPGTTRDVVLGLELGVGTAIGVGIAVLVWAFIQALSGPA